MTTPLDKKQSPPTAHQPLSEIGYACGFRDDTHFPRRGPRTLPLVFCAGREPDHLFGGK
jgi:hypothetical protein